MGQNEAKFLKIFEEKKMKRIQNEDLKYEPTIGQNIMLGCKSHMGAILTYIATVRLFKTEKQVKMAKNSTYCLLSSHSMSRMYQIFVLEVSWNQ